MDVCGLSIGDSKNRMTELGQIVQTQLFRRRCRKLTRHLLSPTRNVGHYSTKGNLLRKPQACGFRGPTLSSPSGLQSHHSSSSETARKAEGRAFTGTSIKEVRRAHAVRTSNAPIWTRSERFSLLFGKLLANIDLNTIAWLKLNT